jgi:hypothetical protein
VTTLVTGGAGGGGDDASELDVGVILPTAAVVRRAAEMRRLHRALDPAGGTNESESESERDVDVDVFRAEAAAARVEAELGSLVIRLRGVVRHLRREVDGVLRGVGLAAGARGGGGGESGMSGGWADGRIDGGGVTSATPAGLEVGAGMSLAAGWKRPREGHSREGHSRAPPTPELMPPTPLPRHVPVSTPSPAGGAAAKLERRFGDFMLD